MSLLEMRGIRKAFNGVTVLDGVDLRVGEGEVHALLGENGAGKSTLMNILTGVHERDAGEITFAGQKMEHITIHGSEQLGIAFVHQELNLFNDLTVCDNIFLGKEYTGALGKLNKRKMAAEARALFERLGVDIDPMESVDELKASEKQLLEISKALFENAKLIILDEPTTSLNTEEVEHLFEIVRGLRKEGISFIFISHKMPEIFRISDRYTVLRNGVYIGEGEIAGTDPETVTRMMVGAGYSSADVYSARKLGDVVLSLKGFTGPGFADVDLDVREGEIVGLTGLQGAGSSELLQCVFGSLAPAGGTMTVRRRRVRRGSVHEAMAAGIGMLPTNRKENSVIPDQTILENMYLAEQTLSAAKLPVHKREETAKYETFKRLLNIKAASPEDPILSLSGGNQQKVFIARWLNTGADILLFDNPTQGIDVGAKAEIYRLILELAEQGKTIIINTLEIPELQKVADRCVVFYNGGIIKTLPHDEIEETTVMMYSTNALGGEAAL